MAQNWTKHTQQQQTGTEHLVSVLYFSQQPKGYQQIHCHDEVTSTQRLVKYIISSFDQKRLLYLFSLNDCVFTQPTALGLSQIMLSTQCRTATNFYRKFSQVGKHFCQPTNSINAPIGKKK